MRAYCDSHCCTHNRLGECQREEIVLNDGECANYENYVANSPLYQNEYFKRCQATVDGNTITFRAQGKGLRYEWNGFVLYTESDIRFSMDLAEFTEEITGLRLSYERMNDADAADIIRKRIEELPPLMELPWMEKNIYNGKLVPHEEKNALPDEITLPDNFEIALA